jgi:hypothetical protein
MNELFIHVGLPKTATTFLQRLVFPKMDINYISINSEHTINYIINSKIRDDKINLISDEELYGDVFSMKNMDSGKVIAKRLRKLYPKAKIIVVLREKEAWTKSLYKQFMRNPQRAILVNNYDQWYENFFNHKSLDFNGYIKVLKSLFNDVLILNFEELKKDNKNFVSKIADFMNVPMPEYENKRINVGLNDKHLKFIRLCGKLPGSYLVNDNISRFFKKIN